MFNLIFKKKEIYLSVQFIQQVVNCCVLCQVLTESTFNLHIENKFSDNCNNKNEINKNVKTAFACNLSSQHKKETRNL